ncbi:MAG: hypothetical protein IJZ15_05360 [Oscillospiraceae bacterium]|nr:hypothetical protein [Oscillospiraceae bacterium]
MKRLFVLLILLSVMFSVCGCAKTSLNTSADVTLTYVYDEKNICVALEDAEAEKVISILNGNTYDPALAGVPSCGFDENVSLKVGDQVFAIALDDCDYILDIGKNRYFTIPSEYMVYIRSLFEKYGGRV